MSEEKVEEIAKRRAILNPHKQRVVWARLTTIKRILIAAGLTTNEKFEKMADAMVRDIDAKVLESVKKDLGLDAEEAEDGGWSTCSTRGTGSPSWGPCLSSRRPGPPCGFTSRRGWQHMSEKQIQITVRRGPDGDPGVVEHDEFVLIGWDVTEDGGQQTITQTSAVPGQDAEHLLVAAKALARAMKKHANPAAMAIGTIMENTIDSGLEHLQRALEGDVDG